MAVTAINYAMKKMLLAGLTALLFFSETYSQEIMSMGRATVFFSEAVGEGSVFYDKDTDSSYNICWFSFTYPSTSGDGQPITLSALACMPDVNDDKVEINNVIAGCHITITDNKNSPTEYSRTGNMLSDVFLTMIHACTGLMPNDDMAYNNLIILPDYEGYGITKDRAHPYLCEEATARQVTDAIRYGIQLYLTDEQIEDLRHPFRQGWRTICTGYSQGGAVAMATQRYIEQHGLSEELHLAGSLCGDGPYSPLATILYYLEKDHEGTELSLPVVLPLMLKGLCDYDESMKGHKVSDYLDERFLETGVLDWLTAKNKTTDDITNAWIQLYKTGKNGDQNYYHNVLTSDGKVFLRNVLKPEMLRYLDKLLEKYPNYATTKVPLPEGGNLTEDLHLALEHNNLTIGWEPSHPVCLYHSTGDEVVPFQNYQSAASHLGTYVQFYPSEQNGTHVSTGAEFFISSARTDCFRMLATYSDDGAIVPSFSVHSPNESIGWHDLSGRRITGIPTTKGIYISNGKKIMIR